MSTAAKNLEPATASAADNNANSNAPATPAVSVMPPPGAAAAEASATAAGSVPVASSAPAPESEKGAPRHQSPFNQGQLEEIDLVEQVGTAAQDKAFADALKKRKITPAFTTTLLTDAGELRRLSTGVLLSGVDGKLTTAQTADCEQKLVGALRQAQTAARQEFKQSNPLQLEKYLIGEDITVSRQVLVQSSQTILTQTNTDRPAGTDTDFVQQITEARTEYVACKPAQAGGQSDTDTERAQRDTLVESVKRRRQQIQLAVEFLWPSGVAANEAVRRRFRLPVDRPYLA